MSALIPTYNRRAQVLRAVDSVLTQTVPVDEIIVVDDGSTDNTAEAIRSRYGPRVKLFSQENKGVSAARNRGLREARGHWIAFLDSADVWSPTKIECQLEALTAFGGEFGLCFTDCAYDGDPERKISVFAETGFGNAPRFGSLDRPAGYILTSQEPFYTPSLLILRSLLEELGGFNESLTVREDTDVLFRLTFKTKFCFVAEPLVRIDRSPSRAVGLCNLYATRDDRKYDSLQQLYTKWLTMYEVVGTGTEELVRGRLRLVCYDSAESKIHQLRIRPALRELRRIRDIGDRYPSIIVTLFWRKAAKLLPKLWSLENGNRAAL